MYSRAPLLGVVLVLVSLSPTLASAGIERGDLRISAGLAAVSYKDTDIESEDFKSTTVEIASGALFQFGKITANSVELGLKLGLFFENIERPAGHVDATRILTLPYVALNTPFGKSDSKFFSPSIASGYSGTFSEVVDIHSVLLELGAEAKFFMAKDASVDLGLFFTYESGTADAGGFRNDLDVEGFTIGPRMKISIWP